jgi:hypothetical protein
MAAEAGELVYRAIVERHVGKPYWTSPSRKSMSLKACGCGNRPQGGRGEARRRKQRRA